MTPLVTPDQMQLLLSNGAESAEQAAFDPRPVVKLFTPDATATWLISEADPDNPDLLFGLCDLGLGFPELGYVTLSEITALRGRLNLPAERDLYFVPRHTIGRYAALAAAAGHIVYD